MMTGFAAQFRAAFGNYWAWISTVVTAVAILRAIGSFDLVTIAGTVRHIVDAYKDAFGWITWLLYDLSGIHLPATLVEFVAVYLLFGAASGHAIYAFEQRLRGGAGMTGANASTRFIAPVSRAFEAGQPFRARVLAMLIGTLLWPLLVVTNVEFIGLDRKGRMGWTRFRTIFFIRMAAALAVAVVALGWSAIEAQTSAEPESVSCATFTVSASNGVNVRDGPSRESARIGAVAGGTIVQAVNLSVQKSEGWTEIVAPMHGFVNSEFLVPAC